MRHFTMAGAVLAVLGVTAVLSSAHADSYYGPMKVGNQCWTRQGHNSLGYWTACKPTESASVTRTRNSRR
jgi:hypothetical protein